MSTRLQGRKALVTGASSGIGREVAVRFAAEGAAVACGGRDEARTQDTVDRITAAGGTAVPVVGDVSEPEGARVTIDGVGWGVTPLTVKYLSPGTKQLRVTLEGFASQELMVRVPGKAAQTSVHVELQQNDEPVVD